ncbi:MAG: OmpA family protein [Treponema sp.]|nr:OmpA family protein [Candidatus Treponema caballi]
MLRKRTFQTFAIIAAVFFFTFSVSAQSSRTIASESSIDWTTKTFYSSLSLTSQTGAVNPSARTGMVNQIMTRLPSLIKDPLLSLYVDSANRLSDIVLENTITLEELTEIINAGYSRPAVFTTDMTGISVHHQFELDKVGSLMVMHNTPYTPTLPIETVSSRPYTGIVIDARGILSVQGEFVESKAEPCFFPKIWDETMDLLYERNMMDADLAKTQGIVTYSFSEDESLYRDIVGLDPLHISARKIYGANRTDPVISRRDALRILSVPENIELLHQGKIVILLDEDVLVKNVAAPVKDDAYYTVFRDLQQFTYERKIKDISITDEPDSIRISIQNIKFQADSAILLQAESERLDAIAEELANLANDGSFTLEIEGHTASVGKPEGEMMLSVERAQKIADELISRGLNEAFISVHGFGGTKPIEDNDSEEGRAANRRVEIRVVPKVTYVRREN